LLPPDVIFWS